MYLRFQGHVPNLGTASKLGIFCCAFELRDHEDTPLYAANEIHRHLLWMADNLNVPEILDDWEHYRAICWFKPKAKKPLERIWLMKWILEDFGYRIDVVKTRDPGLIIYEDGWQIAAKPRRNRERRK